MTSKHKPNLKSQTTGVNTNLIVPPSDLFHIELYHAKQTTEVLGLKRTQKQQQQ